MSDPIRIGLIGASGFGAKHLAALEKLEWEGMVHLTSVAALPNSIPQDTMSRLEQKGVRWYPQYQSLLHEEKNLDAVSIASPIHLHAPMARAALEQGHYVYMEKPPVPLIQDLDELIAFDRDQKIAVGFQRILIPEIQILKKWIESGDLGKLQSVRFVASWPRPTSYYLRNAWAGKIVVGSHAVLDGPATNALSHYLHLLTYFAGTAETPFVEPTEVEAELYRAREIESYDTSCMRGVFSSGVTFHFTVSHNTPAKVGYRMQITGSRGMGWLENDGKKLGNDLGLPNPEFDATFDALKASLHEFIRFASGKRSRPVCSLADTRGYTLAANASFLSSQGVHSIPSQYWKMHGEGEGAVCAVQELEHILMQSHQEGSLFSEMNVPWGQSGVKISTSALKAFDPTTLASQSPASR